MSYQIYKFNIEKSKMVCINWNYRILAASVFKYVLHGLLCVILNYFVGVFSSVQ